MPVIIFRVMRMSMPVTGMGVTVPVAKRCPVKMRSRIVAPLLFSGDRSMRMGYRSQLTGEKPNRHEQRNAAAKHES
jgi:hypothetical protein